MNQICKSHNLKASQRPAASKEKGQSLVEMALILPLLLLLLMGVIDVGRALYAYTVVNDAAAEGIIYGTMFPTDRDAIITRARESADGYVTLDAATIDVQPNPINPVPGSLITVTVVYDIQMITPIMDAMFPGGVHLRGQSVGVVIEGGS